MKGYAYVRVNLTSYTRVISYPRPRAHARVVVSENWFSAQKGARPFFVQNWGKIRFLLKNAATAAVSGFKTTYGIFRCARLNRIWPFVRVPTLCVGIITEPIPMNGDRPRYSAIHQRLKLITRYGQKTLSSHASANTARSLKSITSS